MSGICRRVHLASTIGLTFEVEMTTSSSRHGYDSVSADVPACYFGLAGGSTWGLMIGSLAGRLGKLGVPGGGVHR